jgi:hypothetical protein
MIGTRLGVMAAVAKSVSTRSFALTGDVRHIFCGNMSRTTYTFGVRVQPRLSQIRRQLDEKTARVKSALDELIRVQEILLPTPTALSMT